ncbi:MAG: TetR/AcrR family transcriptional regulator [Actinobacteria bacterium]|nr:TetR/AcrR family transcriptional regulator [Actinomycetota bacterium]
MPTNKRRHDPARSPRARRPSSEERQEHRERRRAELIEAAVAAIDKHGPGASMEQIARAAGVTKPILYRHVGGREEFVGALTDRFVGDLVARLDAVLNDPSADPRDLIRSGIEAYLEMIETHTALYRFLLRHAGEVGGGEVLSQVIREIAQTTVVMIGERIRQAGGDSGAAQPWGYGIVGMVHAVGDWWVESRSMPRGRLADYLVALVWDGMAGATVAAGATPATGRVQP